MAGLVNGRVYWDFLQESEQLQSSHLQNSTSALVTAPHSYDPKAPCVTRSQPCQPESFCFSTPTTLSRDLVNLGTSGDFWVGFFFPESFGLPLSSGRRVWFRENHCTTPHLWAYFKRKEEIGISLEREEEAGTWLGKDPSRSHNSILCAPKWQQLVKGVQLPRVIGSLTEWEQDIPLV